jgi:hypothetical protein
MMHGGGLGAATSRHLLTNGVSSLGSGATINTSTAITKANLSLAPITFDPRTLDQQMGMPMLDSNPGAPATLYLDFNGNTETGFWYYDGSNSRVNVPTFTTPVFDTDGNTGSFSASEQALIKQIWSRVAEDYAPFNINVSTDYYGDFKDKQALHVVIGGNNTDWLHGDASGVSVIGSFSDPSATNEVFVFDMTKWTNVSVEGKPLDAAAAIATTASHEAGHAFGLRHHSLYNSNGTVANWYNPGTSDWTPIMGENKASDRTTWFAGPTDQGSNTYQDDMAIIAGPTNGFGYRTDDHADIVGFADALTTKNVLGTLIGKGIINTPTDVDVFKFTTQGGPVQITMNANTYGPNLIPVVELRSSAGFVTKATTSSSTQSIINTNLPAGTYYVFAEAPTFTFNGRRFGDYGDVGQYTLSVSFGPFLTQGYQLLSSPTATSAPTTGPTSTNQPLYATTLSTASYGSGAGQGNLLFHPAPLIQFAGLAFPSDHIVPKSSTIAERRDLAFEEFEAELVAATTKKVGSALHLKKPAR